jgi:hypothetical protein
LQNPVCSKRDGPQGAAAVRSDTRNLARASLVTLSSIEGLFFDRSALGGNRPFLICPADDAHALQKRSFAA